MPRHTGSRLCGWCWMGAPSLAFHGSDSAPHAAATPVIAAVPRVWAPVIARHAWAAPIARTTRGPRPRWRLGAATLACIGNAGRVEGGGLAGERVPWCAVHARHPEIATSLSYGRAARRHATWHSPPAALWRPRAMAGGGQRKPGPRMAGAVVACVNTAGDGEGASESKAVAVCAPCATQGASAPQPRGRSPAGGLPALTRSARAPRHLPAGAVAWDPWLRRVPAPLPIEAPQPWPPASAPQGDGQAQAATCQLVSRPLGAIGVRRGPACGALQPAR